MKQMCFLFLLLSFISTSLSAGSNSLYEACSMDNIEHVKTLLSLGVNINDDTKMTPLCLAVLRENTEIIKILIAAGAIIDIQNAQGETPLQLAITFNKLENAKILLKHGANVNMQDHNGLTPLHFAIINNNSKIIRLLLEHGANQNIKNKKGFSPKDIALFAYKKVGLKSYKKIVKLLKSYSK